MALAITKVPDGENVEGHLRSVIADVVFDAAYAALGMPVAPAAIGLSVILGAREIGGNAASAALLFQYDAANKKLIAIYPTGGGAASPAALADPAVTAGAVAMTSNAANGAADFTPGRGKEVAAGTDLSTISIRLQFIGY